MGNRIVRTFLALVALFQLSVSVVFASNVVYLMKRGVSLLDFSVLGAVFWSIQLVMSVPAGAYADISGRKRSFVMAAAVCSLGMFQYSRATGFAGCLAAEVLLSLGFAFAGGPLQAWMVDALKRRDEAALIQRALSGQQQALAVSNLVGSVIGVHLAHLDDRAPWIAGGCAFALTAVVASFAIDETRKANGELELRRACCGFVDKIRRGASQVRGDRSLRVVMLLGGVQLLAVQSMNMQWQPHFLAMVPDKTWLGYVFAAGSLAAMAGSRLSIDAERATGGRRRLLLASQVAVGLTLASAALPTTALLATAIFAANQFGRGLFMPAKDAWLNELAGSEDRATVIAFDGVARCAGIIVGLLLWGLIAERRSIPTAWIAAGATLIAGTVAISLAGKRTA